MNNKSDYLRNAILNHTLRGVVYTPPSTLYLALFTIAPTSSGGGTEVSGGGYVRQVVTFGAPSGFACANAGTVTFPVPTAAWGVVLATAVFDALSGGNMLYFGSLATPKAVDIGAANQVFYPVGYLTISET